MPPAPLVPAQPGSLDNPLPRRAARVLLIDRLDRVLLFRGFDPAEPSRHYWFTPGGGLDDAESMRDGAARELREETGLALSPEQLGEAVWHQVTDYPFDGQWFRQEQDFFVARVDEWDVTFDGFDVEERRSIDGHGWWSIEDLTTTSERFYPEELPELLRGILEA